MKLPPPDLPPEFESSGPVYQVGADVASGMDGSGPKTVSAGSSEPGSGVSTADPETTMAILWDALRYPCRGGGWGSIIPGAIMAAVLTFTIWAPWAGLVTFLTVGCYLSAFYFRVVEASVTGDNHPPDWPEFSNAIDDIIIPGCQMFVIYLLSLIPTFLMVWMGGLDLETDSGMLGFGEVIMILTFALYFPMAVLRLIHFGTYGAVLHHRVVPAIFRCLPGYLVAVGAVVLEMVANSLMSVTVGWIPIFGIFLQWFGVIYLMIFSGRVTGLFYRQHRGTLGW